MRIWARSETQTETLAEPWSRVGAVLLQSLIGRARGCDALAPAASDIALHDPATATAVPGARRRLRRMPLASRSWEAFDPGNSR